MARSRFPNTKVTCHSNSPRSLSADGTTTHSPSHWVSRAQVTSPWYTAFNSDHPPRAPGQPFENTGVISAACHRFPRNLTSAHVGRDQEPSATAVPWPHRPAASDELPTLWAAGSWSAQQSREQTPALKLSHGFGESRRGTACPNSGWGVSAPPPGPPPPPVALRDGSRTPAAPSPPASAGAAAPPYRAQCWNAQTHRAVFLRASDFRQR